MFRRINFPNPASFHRGNQLAKLTKENDDRWNLYYQIGEKPSNELYQIHDHKLKSESDSGWVGGIPRRANGVRPGDIKGEAKLSRPANDVKSSGSRETR